MEILFFLTIVIGLCVALWKLKMDADLQRQVASEAAKKVAQAEAEAAEARASRKIVVSAPDPPPEVPKPTGVDLEIPACDVDVFSGVLKAGAVYRLKFSGTYRYDGNHEADAVYYDNFKSSYEGLTIDGKALRRQDSWQEDRKKSEYTCLVEATGKRLRFRLDPPCYNSPGSLTVNIEQLPAGTKSARMLEQEEYAKSVQAFQVGEQQRHAEVCRQKALELKRFVYCHENFLNPKFRAEYLRNHQQDILTTLREQWTQEYDAVFADPTLVAALKADAPEVLQWHEARINLILAAERAEEMPTVDGGVAATPPARTITASTMPIVTRAITELFQFTEIADRERRALAQDRKGSVHQPMIESCQRVITFYYGHLAGFGIQAKTPEEAEMQYFKLCPPPAPTYYEELIGQIKSGGKVSAVPIRARVEDLFREELKLSYQRKRAVERKNGTERDAIDHRLVMVRREKTELIDFLESIGYVVEFKDYRDQEPSVVDEFKRLYEDKKLIKQMLRDEGDDAAAEYVDNLYAQEQAKLFECDTSTY